MPVSDTPPYAQFRQALSEANTVLIAPHVSPDGDTLGSGLALFHAIREHFPHLETIHPVIAGMVPEIYDFLPGFHEFINMETDQRDQLLPAYDLAISCDCGAVERLGPAAPLFRGAKASVNIDHHISNAHFATVNIVETKAGASGEVVANILDAWDMPITREMAEALYVTLLTDTGGFRYASTTPKIFRLAARLLETGLDPEFIYKAIYENRPRAQALLFAQGVTDSQQNVPGTLVWTSIEQDQLTAFEAKEEYLEGLIDRLREIQGVQIAALFKETRNGQTKVSLRSNDKRINVAELLGQFGGGGHHAAAGATLEMSLSEARQQLLPVLEASLV